MANMDPTNTHQALAGRAVLVTGAARRIGAAMARGFHAHGATGLSSVVLASREPDSYADNLLAAMLAHGVLRRQRIAPACSISHPYCRAIWAARAARKPA